MAKRFFKLQTILSIFLIFLVNQGVWAQITYYSVSSGNPAALANWNTAQDGSGVAPANFTSGDIFVIQGTGGMSGAPHTMTANVGNWTITPNNTTGKITIEDGATLSLTTRNVTCPALEVNGTLNIDAGRTCRVQIGSGAPDLIIGATGIVNNDGTFNMDGATTGSISGTINNTGTIDNDFDNNFIFNAGSNYNHMQDGGTIPNATYANGSTCTVSGVTSTVPAGMNRAFSNFTWDCAGQSADITATMNANLQGDLTINNTNGYDFILNNDIDLNGNDLIIGAGGIIDVLANTIDANNATISGILKTASATGLYGGGTAAIDNSGTVTLNAGSTIEYNRAGNQTVTAGTNYSNLVISGSGTKTIANDVDVDNNLTIYAGTTLEVGNDDLTVLGTTSIFGTLADNNNGGVINLANVTMQGGTIDQIADDDTNISGNLTLSSGTNTLNIGNANADIAIGGTTTINAGATIVNSGVTTGNRYFNGAVINNGTWSASGAVDVRFQGSLTNNGTMSTTGTGTYTFDQFDQTIAGSQPITFQGDVLITDGENVTNDNTGGVTFQGQLNGAWFTSSFTNNGIMYYEHNSVPMNWGSFNASNAGNSVYYSLSGNQPVENTTYYNLYISGSGTKTAEGTFTVLNDLNIASGTIFDDDGNQITVNGDVTNNGSATGTGGIFITGGAPPHTITGNGSYQELRINSNTNMTNAAASFSVDDLILDGGALSIGNNLLTINNSITEAGGTLTSTPTQSSITLNGTAQIDLPASITGLNNFTLNNTGGSDLQADLDINGTLTLTQGALDLSGFVLGIASSPSVGGGYLVGGVGETLNTFGSGNITLPANLIQAGSTINLDIDGSGEVSSCLTTVEDLDIAVGGDFTLTCDLSVTGDIINRGTYDGRNYTTTFDRVGAGNQGINDGLNTGTYDFGSIVINTSNQVTLGRSIDVYGDWTLTGGTFLTDNVAREVYFRGSGAQNIGGTLSTTFSRLRTNNTALTISNDQYITNRLTLSGAGKITLGSSDLILSTSTINGVDANSFVVTNGTGRLVRTGAVGALTFPVAAENGGTYYYSPVIFPVGSNDVGVRAVYGQHPDNTCGSEYLNQYWNISTEAGGNLGAGNFNFTPNAGLIVGSPESAYYYGGSWTASGAAVAVPFNINLPALGASEEIDVSGIDNATPTVLSVITSPTVITSAYVGSSTFYVEVVFSETMDTGSPPTIAFNPAQGATLTQQAGAWSTTTYTNDTYRLYYDVANSGVWVDDIDVEVSNGSDACGNLQAALYTEVDEFDIHMNCLTPVDAGAEQHLCEAVLGGLVASTVMAASDPGTATGTWSRVSGPGGMPALGNINSNTTTVTGMAQGLHIFRWTITGGACDGDFDDVYIYNDQPTAADAGLDDESCDGTYDLLANNPVYGTGSWTAVAPAPPTVVFADNTLATTTVSNLSGGDNTLTWTISNGACSSSDAVVIVNNTVALPTAGANQILCTDNTTMVGATVPGVDETGLWTVTQGSVVFTNNTEFNTTVTAIARRDNILRWTITKGGCSNYAEVTISNYSVTANAGLDDYTCDGTYTLQGNNPADQDIAIPAIPATGTWTTPGPGNITDINLYNTYVDNLDLDGNTFRWTMDNGTCSDFDEVVISNDMPTIPNAGPDETFCGIDFAPQGYNSIYNSLTANSPDYARNGIGETGVWTQVAGTSTFLDANTTLNLRVDDLEYYAQLAGPDYWNLNPTVNTYRWTITYNLCELYDEVTITNAAPFPADAGPDQTVCWDNADLNAVDLGNGAQLHWWEEQGSVTPGLTFYDPLTGNVDNTPFNTHVEGLQIATTTFRWYKENTINAVTCNIWDETDVTRVASNLGATSAGSNQIVCSREAYMQGSEPGEAFVAPPVYNVTGEWSVISGGGTFANISSNSTLVTNLNYDTNVLRWTLTNHDLGCIITNDVYITNALPSDANAGPDQNVCTNTALLSAERPTRGTGTWSVLGGGGTISNTTCVSFNCNVYVSNMSTGQNTFLWTTSNSYTDPASGATQTCELTDEIEVWNNSVTAEAGLDQTVCIDDATLAATAPGAGESGVWVRTGGSATVTNPTLYNTTVTGLSPDINTFRWTLSNAFCSDSDDITIINNNPTDPVASTPITDICIDVAPINGNNPLNGTGMWSVSAGGGVITNPSLASTTVTGIPGGVINTYTWTITKNGCPESADVTIYNRSVTADAGTDIDNICGIEPAISTVTLDATQPNTIAGESGNWTIVSSAGTIVDPTAFNTVVNNMDNGTNTFRWTISNGICSDNDLVDVFVYIPTTAVTNPDFEACADLIDIEVLTANAPDPGRGNGTWTLISGGGAIANNTSNISNVTNLGYNENRFRWTIDLNGCTSTDDIIITNNFVQSDAGPDDAICTDVYTLAGNDPTVNDEVGLAQASGQWTVTQGAGVFVDATQFDTDVSGLTTAVTNIFRWTVTKGGCSDWDEVSIINNEFTISANVDQTVCNSFTTLNGEQPGGGQSGLWTVDAGGGNFVDNTLYNTAVNNLSVGSNTFRWTVTNANCSASDDLEVYYNYVSSNAGAQQRVCSTTATLDGNDPPSGASGNWVALLGGATVTTPTLYNSGVTNLGSGQNTFQWTVSNTVNTVTCSDATTVDIFNDIPTTANVEPDNEVCTNSTQLSVLTIPTIGTGVWTAVDNLAVFDNSLGFNPTVTGLNRGINTFRWTVTNQACTSTDDVIITNNTVIANAGVDKSTACADFTTLSGNNPTLTQGTGIWVDLSGTTATIVDNTLYNTSVTGLEQGTTEFQWTVSLGSCSVSDNVQITNNQIDATAGVDQTICNDFYAPLDGNDVSAVGGTGLWISVGNTADVTTPTLFNTGVTNLDPGLNTFRWTVTSAVEGCTDFDEVGITNNSVISNAGSDIETCNTSINLSAVAPTIGSGSWSQASGAPVTIVDVTNRQTQITGLTSGVYAFTWTVTNGACSHSDDVVVTNSSPAVSNPTTPTPETCDGTGVLQANAAGVGETGLWSGGAGSTIAVPSANNTTVSGMPLGVNTYTWTLTKGTNVTCISANSVDITNNQVVASAGSDNTTSCNDFVTLSGNNPILTQGNGLWTDQSGSTATIVNNTLYNTLVTGVEIGTTTFRWTVSQGTCSANDDVVITNNQIVADAGTDQTTCNTFYDPLDGNDVSVSGGTGVWSTTGSGTFVDDTQFNTRVNNLQSGINTLTWTVTSAAEGCTDSDDVIITSNAVTADAGPDTETCNSSINLSANAPTVGTGSWTQTGGAPVTIVNSTDRQSSITGLTGGVYSFTWTVVNGACSASDVVNVTNSSPTVSNPTTPTPESCDGTGVIQANAAGLGETGLWTGGAGSTITDPSANNTTVSGMPLGVNTYTWTLTKGTNVTCVSANSVNITNNQVVATAGPDNTTSCNDFVTLAGNNPNLTQGSGLWTDQSGSTATIVNNTLYNTSVTGVEIGTTTFRWTVSQGTCSANDDVVITNNQIVADAGTDQTTCNTFLDPLDGNDVSVSGGTGVWSTTGSGTFVDDTQFNTRVNNLQSGINTLTWTVTSAAEGCTDSDDVIITSNAVTADAGTDTETCNSSINLSANAPTVGTGSWTQTGGAAATIVTSTDRQSSVTGLTGGVYSFTWTVINGTCSASDVVNVTNSSPTVSNPTTPTPESCDGTGVIQANAPGLGETGLWSGGAGSTIAVPSANNTTVSGMPLGVNTYTWTLTKGTNVTCISANSVNITNNQVVASAGPDNTTSCNDFVTLAGNNPNLTQGNGLWTDETGTPATFVDNTLYNTQVNNVQIGTTTFRWTVSLGTCSAFDEVDITNNQITADAGTDQITCNTFYDPLDGNDVSVSGGTGVWSTTGTGIFVDDTQFNTRVNNLQSGINTLTWTVTSSAEGCTDSDDVIITYDGVTADAGTDIETCNSSINLSAIAPAIGTGSWTQTGGAPVTIVNSTDRQSLVTGLTGGVYSFTWTVVNGTCSALDVVNVTNSSPTVSNPTTPTPETCDGTGTIQANAPGVGETGIWSGGGGSIINDLTANNTTVSGIPIGVQTFTWTLTKGTNVTCTSANSVTITNNFVDANAGADRTTSCNDFVTLSGNNPALTQGNGLWTDETGTTATFVNNTLYNTLVNNVEPGTTTFRWTVSLGTCSDFDEMVVTNNQIIASAGLDQSTCNNFIDPLDGNDVSISGGTGVWSTTGTGTFVDATLYNTRVNNLQSGLNTLTWTVTSTAEGCTDSDDVVITNASVTADAGTDLETCNSSLNLSAIDPAVGTGSWTQSGGAAVTIVNSTDRQTQITGLTGGVYSFTWTVVNGACSASDIVVITNSSPTASNPTTPTPEVCNGNGVLQANAPAPGESGLWTLVDATGTLGNETLNNTTITGLKPGANILRWTLSKGTGITCTSSADVTIINNEVTANAFTSNNISCDATAIVTGNDPSLQGATGAWTVSTGATISNPTYYNNVPVTGLAQGDNIFTWTVSKGTCNTSANVTVTNNQVFATVGGNIDVCGTTATLNGVDPLPNTGLWTLEAGDNPAAISIVTPTLYNSNVTGISKTAIFKWTVTGSTCSDEAFVTVNNNSITVNDGALQTICSSDGTLNAGALDPGQTGEWSSAGSNPVISNSTNPVTAVTNLDFGNNIFFWNVTNTTGCTGSGRHEIVNDSPSPSNAGVDQSICTDNVTLSGNSPLYGTGLWEQVGGTVVGVTISDPTNSSTTVTGLDIGSSTFRWTITHNSCTDADEVVINNNSFVLSAGVDQTLCGDATTFSADAIPSGGTGEWNLVGGTGVITNSNSNVSAVSGLGQGTNTFRWTVTNASGCIVSDEVEITNNQPNVPNVSGDQTTCNNSITISGDAPPLNATGSWSRGAGSATIINANSNVTLVTNLSDNNQFIWTINKFGCTASNTVTITYNGVTASANEDFATCDNFADLKAANPSAGTGAWTLQSGTGIIANSADYETTVTGLSQGDNVFRWTVTRSGCSAYDEITITNNAPDVADAGTTINTCNATFSLLGNNPVIGTGLWTKSVGSTATIINPTLYNTAVNMPIQAMPYSETFTWTITNGVCSDDDIVTVNNNAFIVYANADDYTCNGSYSLLGRDPASVTGTATGNWTVITGNGVFDNSLNYNATVSGLNPGTNSFRWRINDNGCTGYDDVVITNNQVTSSGTGFMTCNSSATITANNPILQSATGLWTVDNQTTQVINNPTSYTTTVSGLVPNSINRFRWTVTKGACSTSDTINVEYYIPNANITIPDISHGCSDTVQLIADPNIGTGTGVWTESTGSINITIDDNTATTTVARNLEIRDNTFIWTVTDRGCVGTDQVSINNSLPINNAGSNQAGCTSNFTMNAETPTATGSGLWSLISGTVTFNDPTSATTTVTASRGTNIVQWTITDNGCSAPRQFTITNNLTNPNAGTDVSVCENRVQLSGSATQPGETGVWSIDGGVVSEVFSSTTVNNPEVTSLRQGIITFVWTVANGTCTAEDRVVVTNNTPTVDAGPDRTICEDYVTLAGNNPDPGNTGVWTIGSGSVNIVNPTAYNTNVTNLSQGSNLFTWTVDNGICIASDDVLITSNAIDVVAGIPYTEDCADTLYLEATVPPVGTNGFWTAVEGGGTFDNSSSYTTIARNLSGFNKLRWTITDGTCSFYDEIDFVSLLPTQASTAADKPVCLNYTQITANPADAGQGESGIWTQVVGSSGVVIEEPTAFQTDVTNLDAGVNVFRWTISNAYCNTSDDITITNNQIFADAGLDQVICDSAYSISANVITGTGVWSSTTPGVVIANSTSPNTTVSGLAFGNNNFQWTLTYNGCTDVDEVIIRSDLPRNVSAGSDQNICIGTTNLSATNPGIGTGLWEVTGGAGTFANATANQTTVTGLSVGENIFKWTVTVGSCSESSQIRVNNNSLYVTAGTNQTICNRDTLVLDGTIPGAGITGTWSVNGGSGTFDNASVYNTTVRGLTKGTNTYVWTLTDGTCTNSAMVQVINNTPDSAKVGADQFICADNTTINAVAVSNGTGQWSLSSGTGVFADPLNNNTDVTSINVGLNTYTWTVTKNGCSLSADVDVTNSSVSAYIADDDIVICTPTHTATIIANAVGAGETGYWTKMSSGAGDITDSQDNVTTVTNLGNGETYFRWTVENGSCSNFDELRITNNYYNTTAAPAGPSTLCVDYSPIIGGSLPIGATGRWSSTAPDVTFDDDTQVSTIVRDLPGGTSSITWTVTKDGCSSPSSFNLLNNAIYTSAGADQVVCNTSTSLNAQGLLSGESGVWTVNNGVVTIDDTADPATAVNNLIVGDNTFTWTLTGNGCTVSDDVIISNNSFGVDAGVDQISCGPSFTIRGSDPLTGTGLWTVSSGTGRFADPTNYETLVDDMENGPNTFTWTVNRNGCIASADVTITNDLYIATAGEDRSVCSDQTTVSAQPLNPTWGASGLWTAQTGGGVFNNPSIESTLVTGLTSGDNRLRWTVTKGTCESFDEIIITNNSITASAGTDETTCNDYATLSATPLSSTGVGLWTGGGAGLVTIVNPTSATTSVTNLQQGVNTFAWTVTDNGCTGTSTVRITSNYFIARAGNDQIITVNNAIMDAQLPDATANGTWSVVSGAGTFANVNDLATTITNLGFGMNTFRWTVDWNTCVAYDDVNITYNVISAVAGVDQVICTDRTYLSADDPWPGTGAWSVVSGAGNFADPLNRTTEVTGIQPGSVNIYRWTVEISGYSEFDDVVVTNGEFETSAGLDRASCNDYVTLAAEPAGSGTGAWTVLAGAGNFANPSLHNTQVTNLEGDMPNIFVWTVTKPTGCVDSDTIQVIYNVPPVAEFETDVTGGCSPIDVTYTNTSTGGYTYYWFFGDDQRTDSSLTSFTRQYTAYNVDSTFSTTLIAYSDSGCSDTITHSITAYSIPIVGFEAYPPVQVFPDATINIENLSGEGYDNYDWDFGDGSPGRVDVNGKIASFSYTYDTWGEFTITLNVSTTNSSSECTDVATQMVQILAPKPTDNSGVSEPFTGCEPHTVNLSANTLYADTYHWDIIDSETGDTIETSDLEETNIIFPEAGTYYAKLTATGPGGTEPIRTDTIIIYEMPIASLEFAPDSVMLPNQPVHFYNRSVYGDDYRWEFGDGTDPLDEENPIHYYTEEGNYFVTLTVYTDNGCFDDTICVKPVVVEPPGVCFFPNAFSPSVSGPVDCRSSENDFENDVFRPKYRGIGEYRLEIFNRWGEKIFESTDPMCGWNGYIDGKLAPQDVYVWKVKGKFRNGVIFEDAGDVTLLR